MFRTSWVYGLIGLLVQSTPGFAGWEPLPNAPATGSYEDVFFANPQVGWVVNGVGHINRTTDGGASWQLQVDEPSYLRSVGFADTLKGWAGSLDGVPLLYATTDGGLTWTPVLDIPAPQPTGICGIWVVNESVVYACGKYDGSSARVIKTTDGGATWTSQDLVPLANTLIDCFFFDADHGFVVGAIGVGSARRAVILGTTDGGATWTTRHTTDRTAEWCWKISFPTSLIGYVSCRDHRRRWCSRRTIPIPSVAQPRSISACRTRSTCGWQSTTSRAGGWPRCSTRVGRLAITRSSGMRAMTGDGRWGRGCTGIASLPAPKSRRRRSSSCAESRAS